MEADKWSCLSCDREVLKPLRAKHWALINYLRLKSSGKSSKKTKRKSTTIPRPIEKITKRKSETVALTEVKILSTTKQSAAVLQSVDASVENTPSKPKKNKIRSTTHHGASVPRLVDPVEHPASKPKKTKVRSTTKHGPSVLPLAALDPAAQLIDSMVSPSPVENVASKPKKAKIRSTTQHGASVPQLVDPAPIENHQTKSKQAESAPTTEMDESASIATITPKPESSNKSNPTITSTNENKPFVRDCQKQLKISSKVYPKTEEATLKKHFDENLVVETLKFCQSLMNKIVLLTQSEDFNSHAYMSTIDSLMDKMSANLEVAQEKFKGIQNNLENLRIDIRRVKALQTDTEDDDLLLISEPAAPVIDVSDDEEQPPSKKLCK